MQEELAPSKTIHFSIIIAIRHMILEETMVSSHWDNLICLCCKYKLQVIFLFHLSELESNEQQREVSDGGIRDGKGILQTHFFETKILKA